MTGCPTLLDWRDFLADRLDGALEAEMVKHAELCDHCVRVLDELSAIDGPGSLPASVNAEARIGTAEQGARIAGAIESSTADSPGPGKLAEPLVIQDARSAAAEPPARPFPIFPDSRSKPSWRGGMGVVYRAWQVKLGRPVAIKTILTAGQPTRDQVMRFLIEAETLARTRHPNIVEVYETGEHRGVSYLVMELVDGGTLSRACGGVPVAPRLAAELVESLARAMHHAHLQGVVHRDLKPDNILMQMPADAAPPAGTAADDTRFAASIPKVTDFGLAKQLAARAHLTLTGTVLGTPAYMAPEQADADPRNVGPAVDIYALGVILYELLTGSPPFWGATPLHILERPDANCRHPPRAGCRRSPAI